jgi:acyl-homoserine lactone acylase PvdQ
MLPIAGGGYLFWHAKRAEPRYSETIRLGGLTAPVTVRYNDQAVPTVEGINLSDLLFAQGYVVAAERMWQMDLMRRLAAGRLAEVVGEKALPVDRFFRTIGLLEAAQRSHAALDEADRSNLAAYAAGVNAYIAESEDRLPLEYRIAGFAPAQWTPEDSLVIAEYMGWVLSFNVREELVFLKTAMRVGVDRALELFPVDEGVAPPTDAPELSEYTGTVPILDTLVTLIQDLGLPTPGAASNAWVVNGHRSVDGHALFASDPHLAPSMPGIWYQLELVSPALHASGVTLPGFPFVVFGHNAHLAWGFTAAIADSQDVFVERVSEDGKAVARPDGRFEPISAREAIIAVKGRQQPERLAIRSTSHGVILNDVLGNNTGTPMDLAEVSTDHRLALRTNFDIPDRAATAFYKLNTATTLDQARKAARDLSRTSVNLMLAHRDEGIAWQLTGALPKRGRGSGKYPTPGWLNGYGWTGYLDSSELPHLVNPASAAIVTANNRTVSPDRASAISHSWMAPYRAKRIQQLLEDAGTLAVGDMARIQRDRISLQAKTFLRALDMVRPELSAIDAEAARIADTLLTDWDAEFRADSRPAALFVLLQPALFQALYADELGDDLPALMSIATAHYNGLEETMHSGLSSYWDDVSTPELEGPAQVWAKALLAAENELNRRLPNLENQRLDAVRRLRFPHAFDRLPILGRLFSVGPLPVGGDSHTIDVMKSLPSAPETVTYIPTLRAVMTPYDWAGNRISLPLGQSGHRFSPYRTDRLGDWLNGRGRPMPWGGPALEQTIGVQRLLPER